MSVAIDREQILAHRLAATGLVRRVASTDRSLRSAVAAGASDSVPRAAVLSIHARLAGTPPDVLDHEALVQVWGPRFNSYVVARDDMAPFTLGRMPRSGAGRRRALDTADRLQAFLDGRTMSYAVAGREMGVHPNSLRYAATTGTVVLHWDGAGRPTITSVTPPDVDEEFARCELARRFLHVLGPATAADFATWAGVGAGEARATFDALGDETIALETPIGEAVALTSDEGSLRSQPAPVDGVRLLPSGDVVCLVWGPQRSLLVPDPERRSELWTSRVWPGALLVDGAVVGVWRRRGAVVDVDPWRSMTIAERDAVEAEAASLPLVGEPPAEVRWPADATRAT